VLGPAPAPEALATSFRCRVPDRRSTDLDGVPPAPVFDRADIENFASLVTSGRAPAAREQLHQLCIEGVPVDSILLDLLAPAARLLGRQWENDSADFMQVTLGVGQMQRLLHELDRDVPAVPDGAPRALFAAAPGEQHTFGLRLVCDFFRRAGWHVALEIGASSAALLERVRTEHFTLVGLSVSCEQNVAGVASLVADLRRESCNHALGVMVGGRPFVDHPERVAMVGADATAIDARQATRQAQNLVEVLANGV
jgi:MerR family transcriptional regulator, light-induced transcriptional regulator